MPDDPQQTPAERQLRGRLAIAARSLSLGGHDDFNQGQVSARLPGSRAFQIKGALTGFDECVPADVIPAEVDPDAPAHRLAPPELALHQAVYAARPDVNGIVHSHAPYTLAFGATDLELRPVSHDGAYFEDRLSRFTLTSNTILDIATGRAVATALGPDPALLLRNHGGLVVGKTLKHAVVLAHLLERACRLQLLVESAPGKYHSSSAVDVEAKRDFIYGDLAVRSYWEHSVRAVLRAFPEAVDW